MEYMLHWWGGCEELVKNRYNYEEYMYFNSEKERQVVIDNLMTFNKYGLVIDRISGELTHTDTVAVITCLYKEKEYKFDYNFGKEYPDDAAEFMFFEGNNSCDCNKCLFIQRYCDEAFPDMDCGDEIKIIDFRVEHR